MKHLLFSVILFISWSSFAQINLPSECCENPKCNEQVEKLSYSLISALVILGESPDDDNEKQIKIIALTPIQQQTIHDRINELLGKSDDFKICIQNKIQQVNISNWLVYFMSFSSGDPRLPSPNFNKGWDIFLGVNFLGGSGIFSSEERFTSLYTLHFGRTIGRKDLAKSRKFRWLIGGSIYYTYDNSEFMLSPRLEWRFTDLEFSPINLGALKIHLDAHLNSDFYLITTGLSIETYRFGINFITLGYDDSTKGLYANTGLFINFTDFKK